MAHATKTTTAPEPGSPSFRPFVWPQAGRAISAMDEMLHIQTEMIGLATRFGQEAATMMSSDFELATAALRRLVAAKSPEEFAATQRDMVELISAKYFEQWLKLGEEMKELLVKSGGQASRAMDAATHTAAETVAATTHKRAA